MKRERPFGGMMMAVYRVGLFCWVISSCLLFFPGPCQADFGQVIKVKGGTIQRINASRRINNMLNLDNMVFEKDILRGDGQAMAVLKTNFGDWYLGKNVELQLAPNDQTLLEITHGPCKIISPTSLHTASPVKVGDLTIQFMHKFGLVEEGEGDFKGGWLISGLALLTLKSKDKPVQRFELSNDEWLIFYHVNLGTLKAYPLKRPKFLRKENCDSFFRDYREVYANEVLEQVPFLAVTPTPVPQKKVIRAPEELRLSEGLDQQVNLTGDPDQFLDNYYQMQVQQQAKTPTAIKRKAKNKSSPPRGH